MKIVAQTPTELIIRDSALVIRAVGSFVAAIGAFAIALGFTSDPDGRVGAVPVVIGSLLVIGGLLLAIMPKRKTFAFSRAEKRFVIAKERFGRVERQAFPLDQVVDVTLEESPSSDGGSTYRISVTLADQRHIPWTSYYSSGFASKQAIVGVVHQFLRLDPMPSPETGVASATTERAVRRGQGLALMAAFCSIFLAVGRNDGREGADSPLDLPTHHGHGTQHTSRCAQ